MSERKETVIVERRERRKINRVSHPTDGGYMAGIAARIFTEDIVQYLFDSIAMKEDREEE